MEYRIPTNDKPTFFNKDAALGALIGTFMGPIGVVAGAAVGAYIGNKRMEKDLVEGKVAKEPTTLNALFSKDAAIDGWVGRLGGLVAGMAIAALVTGTFLPAVGIGVTIVKLAGVAGMLLGAFKGADSAKEKMEREYREAKLQRSMLPSTPIQSPTKEQATVMEQEQSPDRSFAAAEQRRRTMNVSLAKAGTTR